MSNLMVFIFCTLYGPYFAYSRLSAMFTTHKFIYHRLNTTQLVCPPCVPLSLFPGNTLEPDQYPVNNCVGVQRLLIPTPPANLRLVQRLGCVFLYNNIFPYPLQQQTVRYISMVTRQ